MLELTFSSQLFFCKHTDFGGFSSKGLAEGVN